MKLSPCIRKKEELARSRFLALTEVHFTDEAGRERRWDAAERVNSRGAVVIVATIEPEGKLVLVKQFRPPAGRYLVEFPAGLVDPGETAEATAVRELWEETGYRGDIIRIHPPSYNSPGLSGETVTLVEMRIDGTMYPEPPENHQEEMEHIETLLVHPDEFERLAREEEAADVALDAKVEAFFLARQWQCNRK